MPHYEYRCDGCGKTFEEYVTLAEKEKKKTVCPACGARKVKQQFSGFFAKTSRKS